MKAVRIHGHGGPEVLRYEDVPDPSPGSGEVLIDLKAVGVNFADIGERLGRIPRELPATVGREAAGVVSQVGEGVSEVEVGRSGGVHGRERLVCGEGGCTVMAASKAPSRDEG